ncbi:MAG: hypothetical protein AAGD05_03965 [Bacteroidota bacterium]
MSELKIECPKCQWEPDGGAHWQCTCGHVWNTFDTAGRCPACGFQWKETWCPSVLGCGRCSPHLDWYKNLDDLLAIELEKIVQYLPAEV